MNLTGSGWLIFILISLSSALLYFDAKSSILAFMGTVVLDRMFDIPPPGRLSEAGPPTAT